MTTFVSPDRRPETLAAIMLFEIGVDFERGAFSRPERAHLGRPTSFSDLHDHVDANEYIIEALERVAWEYHADDAALMDAVNAATDLVSIVLGNPRLGYPYFDLWPTASHCPFCAARIPTESQYVPDRIAEQVHLAANHPETLR